MQLTLAAEQIIDDAVEDLNDSLRLFKTNPSVETLDEVYRATTAIETACRDQLKK